MREKRLLLNDERRSSSAESSSTDRDVLDEIVLRVTPQKKSFRNKRDRISAQTFEIINFDYLEAASWQKKKSCTNIPTTSTVMITRSVKKASDGNHPLQHSDNSVAVRIATAYVITDMTEGANKTWKTCYRAWK